MRWKRIIGIGCFGLLFLIAASGLALWYFAPGAPPVEIAEPKAPDIRVTDNGLLANYYPAEGAGPHPAILFLGGSEGGITKHGAKLAKRLQTEGFSVLYPSYYRGPGQSEALEMVPLETFDKALNWLKSRSDVDPENIGIIGGSKGAEAALITATRHPDIAAVVAAMPSNVSWAGIRWGFTGMQDVGASWSLDEKPYPFLPYDPDSFSFSAPISEFYRGSLKALPKHPDAQIALEKTRAPILLICGEKDTLWPSCDMARAARKRAEALAKNNIQVLAYPDAGHGVFGLPRDPADKDFAKLASMGGSPKGNNDAREDNWPRILEFLTRELKPAK